jgi:hypothetical protein
MFRDSRDLWEQFLSIDTKGNLECATADHIIDLLSQKSRPGSQEPIQILPYWNYVKMLGMLWSTLEIARLTYIELAYTAGVNIRVSLIGTHNGRMAGSSQEEGAEGKKWRDPLSQDGSMRGVFANQICEDQNLLIRYQATQKDLGGIGARKLIDDFADKIALAFNYQDKNLPCFNCGTRDFPWGQFQREWNRYY